MDEDSVRQAVKPIAGTDAQTLEVLTEISAKLDCLPALAEALQRVLGVLARHQTDGADSRQVAIAEMVRLIRARAEDALFSSSELIADCLHPANVALRDAVTAALGDTSAMKLEHLLKKIEGINYGGIAIVRHGEDRDGIVWRAVEIA